MTVVSNSGPLMALGKLGQLDLLFRLFGHVKIPAAVYREVVIEGGQQGHFDALVAEMAIRRGQLEVVDVGQDELPSTVASLSLDAGEKEVIYLGTQISESLVLLDDLKAREEAKTLGLPVRGTLGVLVQAYRASLVTFEEIETLFDAIISRDDIWVASGLCREVIKRVKAES